jgi:uncharacterized membrane protein YvlD (DUF360 family)
VIRFLVSLVINLAANALGLLVAAALLDDMTISGTAFVIAVLIFSVVEAIVQPMLRQAALRNAQALAGSTALITTFVGLIITSLLSDGLEIEGAATWLLATLIVWAASLLAAWVLPLIFVKNKVEERRGS